MAEVSNPDYENYSYYKDQYTDAQYTDDNRPTPYEETQISSYNLMRREVKGSPGPDVSEWKTQHLVDFLRGESVVTNINGTSVGGYSLGAALLHKPADPSATVYAFNILDADYWNYHNFKTCLANIFQAKTQQLGKYFPEEPLYTAGSFEGFFVEKDALLAGDEVNSSPTTTPDSFVYSDQASTSLNLDLGNYSGIIYCEGNLNITGNGTFNGAIIAEGNVTVSGNPTITYNEGVIKRTLMSQSNIRNFFTLGNMGGVTYGSYTTASYDGAVRTTNAVRYGILEWKEKQQ